jgi:hypothetical protein
MVAKIANESLTLLGVDGHLNPTVSRYPKAYNHKALKHWVKALEKTPQGTDTLDTWMKTIRQFLSICKDADIDPFDHANAKAVNKGIEDWLKSNRVKAVKYCNDTELFKFFTISSATRTAAVAGQAERNFHVVNTARLKANEDPTLEKWLLGNPLPGFTKIEERSYKKEINAATSIVINFIGSSAATVVLSIYCHSLPIVSGKKTHKALAKHIETKIWTPMVRKYPFNGVKKLF